MSSCLTEQFLGAGPPGIEALAQPLDGRGLVRGEVPRFGRVAADVEEFDGRFSKDLATAADSMPNVKRDGVPVEEKCPKCGSDLVMRFGRYGAFLGCSAFRNDPPCDYTRDLTALSGADVNGTWDTYVHDMQMGGTVLASVSTTGVAAWASAPTARTRPAGS